jgi:hypothetical protein
MSQDFPLARSQGLITEELDGELLVYDSEHNLAHALGADAAAVWRSCDGGTDIRALATRCAFSEHEVQTILARLEELGLLETSSAEHDGDTRRVALRKITIAGAGIAAIPTISSLAVPAAAQASSCFPVGQCVDNAQACCTGYAPHCPGSCPHSAGQCRCIPAGSCAFNAPPNQGFPPASASCCNGSRPDSSCPSGVRCA